MGGGWEEEKRKFWVDSWARLRGVGKRDGGEGIRKGPNERVIYTISRRLTKHGPGPSSLASSVVTPRPPTNDHTPLDPCSDSKHVESILEVRKTHCFDQGYSPEEGGPLRLPSESSTFPGMLPVRPTPCEWRPPTQRSRRTTLSTHTSHSRARVSRRTCLSGPTHR